jgi:hypothetical protein
MKNHIPPSVCYQERITKFDVFGKCALPYHNTRTGLTITPGKDSRYEKLFTTVRSSDWNSRRTVELRHYPEGLPLKVDCCDFRPTDHYQFRALRKNSSGWHAVKTSSYRLLNATIDISPYVQQCVEYSIDEACRIGDIASFFFKQARLYSDVSNFSAL